jgi:hypothetical protein
LLCFLVQSVLFTITIFNKLHSFAFFFLPLATIAAYASPRDLFVPNLSAAFQASSDQIAMSLYIV